MNVSDVSSSLYENKLSVDCLNFTRTAILHNIFIFIDSMSFKGFIYVKRGKKNT